MMTFALLAAYQILEVCLWQGKSESDIHGTYFLRNLPKNCLSITLEILAPTVTYFKKNTFGAINSMFLVISENIPGNQRVFVIVLS